MITPETTIALAPQGQIEKGQTSKFSEDEVLTLCDMHAKAFELGAILQHSTAYGLIDFQAKLQVAFAARMAQDHAENQVIERALDNEPASDVEPKLQRVSQKRVTKKRDTHIELPKLNTTLVEVYHELNHTTQEAKDTATNIQIAHNQAKAATDLWQATEAQRVELETIACSTASPFYLPRPNRTNGTTPSAQSYRYGEANKIHILLIHMHTNG